MNLKFDEVLGGACGLFFMMCFILGGFQSCFGETPAKEKAEKPKIEVNYEVLIHPTNEKYYIIKETTTKIYKDKVETARYEVYGSFGEWYDAVSHEKIFILSNKKLNGILRKNITENKVKEKTKKTKMKRAYERVFK